MQSKFGIIFLFVIIINIDALGITVRGKITTTTDTAIQYALVRFVLANDTSVVFSTTTDTLGEYTIVLTEVSEPATTTQSYTLYQNYPNPFSEQTAISYSIKENSYVAVTIYDILGRKVKSFDQSYQPSGTYSVEWNGMDEYGKKVSYGIYFYRITSKQGVQTKKMVYVNPGSIELQLNRSNINYKTLINDENTFDETYTVYIENTDSTHPIIEPYKAESVIISGDTIINFQVEANKWKFLGLGGKLVSELTLHKNYLYACAGGDGLYRLNLCSENPQWKYLGLADSSAERGIVYGINSITIINDTILVGYLGGTNKAGIYRSTDNGETWLPSDSGLYKSNLFPATSRVNSVQASPYSPNIVIATLSAAIYKSTDYGRYWLLTDGVPEASSSIFSIKFNPKSQNEIWTGEETGRLQAALRKSNNLGETWNLYAYEQFRSLGYYTDNAIYDIEIDPMNDSVMYFGMFTNVAKTTDKGKTFKRIFGWEDGLFPYRRLGINLDNPQEILAIGAYLYRTKNGGDTWYKIKLPEGHFILAALAVDWQNRIAYVSTGYYGGYGIFSRKF